MNSKLLLILLIIAGFSSCTTAYKTGQTPDDVYFSPGRPLYDNVQTRKDKETTVYNSSSGYYNTRLQINTRRWRRYYGYDNNCYQDYDGNLVYYDIKTGKAAPYVGPRKVNLGAYKKNPPAAINIKTGKPENESSTNVRTFKPRAQSTSSGTGVGNFLREVFTGNNNSSSGNGNSGNGNSGNGNAGTKTTGGSSTSGSGSHTTTVPVRKFGN